MLNNQKKKEAREILKRSIYRYEKELKHALKASEELYETKKSLMDYVLKVEKVLESFYNVPEAIKDKMDDSIINIITFKNKAMEKEEDYYNEINGKGTKDNWFGGIGMLSGIGLQMFGPGAAVAFATTFGTASTGVAISGLSGVAASNAALAWLGGGALVAGGAGMAGGAALLKGMGPVGMAITGTSAVIASKSNQKKADLAMEQSRNIDFATDDINEKCTAIKKKDENMRDGMKKNNELLKWIQSSYPRDYDNFTQEQKKLMFVLVENIELLSKELNSGI